MLKIRNIILSCSLLFVFSVANGQIKLGDTLPDLKLQSNENTEVELSSFNRKNCFS